MSPITCTNWLKHINQMFNKQKVRSVPNMANTEAEIGTSALIGQTWPDTVNFCVLMQWSLFTWYCTIVHVKGNVKHTEQIEKKEKTLILELS